MLCDFQSKGVGDDWMELLLTVAGLRPVNEPEPNKEGSGNQ